jgi:hypothetical protein
MYALLFHACYMPYASNLPSLHRPNLAMSTSYEAFLYAVFSSLLLFHPFYVQGGHAAAYFFEALCYKPESLGFDSR